MARKCRENRQLRMVLNKRFNIPVFILRRCAMERNPLVITEKAVGRRSEKTVNARERP